MLLEYTLQLKEEVQNASPMVNKAHAMMQHLIHSAKVFATDPQLEAYLDDEHYSNLIV